MAITDAEFTYSPARVGRLSISPLDMSPNSDESAAEDYRIDAKGILTSTGGTVFGCYNTGVNLPNDASITRVRTCYKSGPGPAHTDLGVIFTRHELQTGNFNLLVNDIIEDNSDARVSVTHIPPGHLSVVNNAGYAYGFTVCLGEGTEFYGAQITYRYTSAGD